VDVAAHSLGPYRLVASLGRGGQAEVFLAVRRGLAGFSKLIVIKSIRQDMEHDPKFREALMSEAKLAARLQHPNVVQTLEVGDQDGRLYIAMEFLDGQPLHRVLKRAPQGKRPLGLPLASAILSDMLAGLHSAHELRDYDGRRLEVIHRDVSPHNVFVTYEGEVKIVDFGIAKAEMGGEATESGIVKGKAAYMAPEQALGERLDRRVDLYAAGIIAWELFSGRRPFSAERPVEMRALEPAPPLASAAPQLPKAIADMVDKALERDRNQRHATAAEMRDALEAALEKSGVRKAPREEVGRFVAELFDADRQRLQAQIRESLAAAADESAEHLPVLLPALSGSDSLTPSQPSRATPIAPPPRRPSRLPVLLAFLAGAVILALSSRGFRLVADRSAAAKLPDLRLCGSNTVGAELAPALVQAFLKQRGASSVERTRGATRNQTLLRAGSTSVSIDAAGSATAFSGIGGDQCDIGMASRTMSEEEKAGLAAKGIEDLRTPATEHVIALDGIAVIVHPNNKVRSLDTQQVKAIFTGKIRNWSAVGGAPGPIKVYARDDKSGTYDTFRQLALDGQDLAGGAKRLEDSVQLSDQVTSERNAIGFVGLAFIHSARALAISDHGAAATIPSPFTVANESYPLSRRLYFYTLPEPRTPMVADLVNFTFSADGQLAVRQSGFVDLTITARSPGACGPRCPPEYVAATRGGKRLTVDFRMRPGANELDSRAIRDLDRLVSFLEANPASRVVLLGFADDDPSSLESANLVAGELEKRGVKADLVKGFGAAMPLSARTDAVGRQRNRRVEVWIHDAT